MMSNRTRVFAAIALTALPAFAQPPQGPQPGPDPLGEHLFPPELIMQHQNALGLGDDQKARIREEIGKAQGRFLELQWELQDAMESLLGLVKDTGVSEERILSQLDAVLESEREIKRSQLMLLIRIKNSLTPEQQEKLQQIRRGGGRPGSPQRSEGTPSRS